MCENMWHILRRTCRQKLLRVFLQGCFFKIFLYVDKNKLQSDELGSDLSYYLLKINDSNTVRISGT